jgi:hypothetical protein
VSHINPLPYLWVMMLGPAALLPAVLARRGSLRAEVAQNAGRAAVGC